MADFIRVPETDWQGICDAVREKTGETALLKSGGLPEAIAGIQTEADPVLEELTVTENGEYTPGEGVDGFGKVTVNVDSSGVGNILEYAQSLNMAFNSTAFETGTELDISFGAKASLINSNATYGTFHNASGLKSIKLSCGFATPTNVSMQNFVRCSTASYELEVLDLSGLVNVLIPTHIGRAFEYQKALREILGEFDATNCATLGNFVAACSALEVISFKNGTIKTNISLPDSPNLTDATIQNIIDGLADLTDGTAQTLTLHADVGAKLTDEQKTTISGKNWTLAY